MPLTGATYQQRNRAEILAFLEAELRAEFGEDIDLTDSSAFRTFAEAISGVDAQDIEPTLEEVHNAAFLDTATGDNLDNLVSLLGISRRSAVHSTGVIEFRHDNTTVTDYTIDSGTIVQTDSDEPVLFETIDAVTLSVFDDFESGTLNASYIGQTGDFNVVDGSAASDPSPTEGGFMLRADAVNNSSILLDSKKVSRGSRMVFRNYIGGSSGVLANLFGVIDSDNHYRIKIDESGNHAIEVVTQGGGVSTLQSDGTINTPKDEWIRNEVDWEGQEQGRIVSRVYDSNDNILSEITVTGEDRIDEGGFGFESLDASVKKYWDHSGENAIQTDARSIDGGVVGNIGANTLTIMPSVPSGVDSVTNPWSMGSDDNTLTDTTTYATGLPEETDEELRERATVSQGARGKGTVPAVLSRMSGLSEAESVSVYENKTNVDNTPSGLPPKSFEVVYYGSDPNQDIADSLFDVKGFTTRDHGGSHGTEITETVTADNKQQFTMHWSEPNKVNVNMTLSIVANTEFIGEDKLRDRLVEYMGGTRSNGTTTLGTGTGEDVYVDQVEDVVTGPEDTGVIGISSYSFTPSTTTDTNNLEVVSIGSNEVARTNGKDGSITLNITRV